MLKVACISVEPSEKKWQEKRERSISDRINCISEHYSYFSNEKERIKYGVPGIPLERIIELKDRGATIDITTTHEKLAQRIGKKIHKACQGELEIKWTKDKITRVVWER